MTRLLPSVWRSQHSLRTLSCRRHASTHHRHQQADALPGNAAIHNALKVERKLTDIPEFMKRYSTRDLLSYTLLSFVTSQPSLLKLATKLLPYTPTPVVKAFVCPIYCGGETFEEVRGTARKLLDRGIGNMMLSYAVEDANGELNDEAFIESMNQIKQCITEVLVKHNDLSEAAYASGEASYPPASGYIALKPTGLMKGSANILANFDKPEYADRYEKYLDICRSICEHAKTFGGNKAVIVFDAEKDWLQKGVYDAQRRMMTEFNRDGDVIVVGTIQMYLQGSLELVQQEIEMAKAGGYQMAMKLVRGAYLHSEPDRDNVIHRTKEDTDRDYNAGTNLMFDYILEDWKKGTRAGPVGRLIVASHNIDSCNMIADRIDNESPNDMDRLRNEDVVFGQLMGMNDDQSSDLTERGVKVIKYVPWGPAKETKEYLTRRLEENGDAARGGWEHFTAGIHEIKNRIF